MVLSTQTSTTSLDGATIREHFPILNQQQTAGRPPLAFLDSAASAQKPRQVLEAIDDCYERYYANVHRGVHWLSQQSTEAFEEAQRLQAQVESLQTELKRQHKEASRGQDAEILERSAAVLAAGRDEGGSSGHGFDYVFEGRRVKEMGEEKARAAREKIPSLADDWSIRLPRPALDWDELLKPK